MAGHTTKRLVEGTAVAVKDVAVGIYDGITDRGEAVHHDGFVAESNENPENKAKLNEFFDGSSSPHEVMKVREDAGEGGAQQIQEESEEAEGKQGSEEAAKKVVPVRDDSLLYKLMAHTTKAMVAPFRSLSRGISSTESRHQSRRSNTAAESDDDRSTHSSKHSVTSVSFPSDASWLDVYICLTNNQSKSKWFKKGFGKRRGTHETEFDDDSIRSGGMTVPETDAEVKYCGKVWKINMNPTLSFLLCDTTIAVAFFLFVFSIPMLRHYSLVVKGEIPQSVYISWVCLAFAIGIEYGRVLGIRSVSMENIHANTEKKITEPSDNVPNEISSVKAAPNYTGYILFYDFVAHFYQVEFVFPKEAIETLETQSKVQFGSQEQPGVRWACLAAENDRHGKLVDLLR